MLFLCGCEGDPLTEDLYVTNMWGDDVTFETVTSENVTANIFRGDNLYLSGSSPIILSGDAQVWIEIRPDLDFTSVRALGVPTYVTRGLFYAFSLPIYGADNEELFFDACIPDRWSAPAWSDLGTVGDEPGGMATLDDILYIPCRGDDNVWIYDGEALSISGNVGDAPVYACECNGKVYVSCHNDDTVWVFNGSTWAKSGDVGTSPLGMVEDGGDLYVACEGDDTVWVLSGGVWALSGNVGTSPAYLAEYGGDIYLSCDGADDDVWVYNGLIWAKDDDVGAEPMEFCEHDGDLYLNCYDDGTVWVRSGGAWAVTTNVLTTIGTQPVGLEEYDSVLYSACMNDVWSNYSGFWNMNVDFLTDEPMFLEVCNEKLYLSCYDQDEIWVYEGETAFIHIHCWVPSAQGNVTDAFRLAVSYEGFSAGIDRVPAISDIVIVEEVTGITATYQSYLITMPLNMAGINDGDNLTFNLRRIASADEIVGEVAINHFGLVYLCNTLGNPTP